MSELTHKLMEKILTMTSEEQEAVLDSVINENMVEKISSGMTFDIVVCGLTAFTTNSVLSEAGFSDDDPRTKRYSNIQGYLIDKKYVDDLRNIQAKKETVAKKSGGIQIGNAGKFVWWIPNNSIEKFMNEMNALRFDYEKVVQDIYDDYDFIRSDALSKVMAAARAAYDDLVRKNSSVGAETEYLDSAARLFDRKFLKKEELHDKICINIYPIDPPMHEVFSEISEEISNERDAEFINRNGTNSYTQMEFGSITDMRKENIRNIRKSYASSKTFDMYAKISYEIEKKVVMLANEVFESVKDGVNIKPQTLRSIQNKLINLKKSSSDVSTSIALDKIENILDDPTNVSSYDIQDLCQSALSTVDEFVKSTHNEIAAEELASMIRSGYGKEALEKIYEQKRINDENRETLNAFEDMVDSSIARQEVEAMEAQSKNYR